MKIQNGRNTITSDIAYVAGFFDGEGCIRLKKANQGGNSYYVWVAITNTNRTILDYIASLLGGSVRAAEYGKNKTIYHFLITSSEATDMLKILLCFLKEKRQQAELAIYFHTHKERLSPTAKTQFYSAMRSMKKGEVIGNVYENPELLTAAK